MDPKKWGPSCWNLLHSITEAYPSKPNMKTQQIYYTTSCLMCIGTNIPTFNIGTFPEEMACMNLKRRKYWAKRKSKN